MAIRLAEAKGVTNAGRKVSYPKAGSLLTAQGGKLVPLI